MIIVIFKYIKLSLIIFFTTFLLILFIDFFLGNTVLRKLDPYLSKTQFYERLIRIDHPIYHHGFRENVIYNEAKNKSIVRKSLLAACAIREGEVFGEHNLTVKRPGTGLSPMRWDEVVGCKSPRDFFQDELIEL